MSWESVDFYSLGIEDYQKGSDKPPIVDFEGISDWIDGWVIAWLKDGSPKSRVIEHEA